MNESLSSLKIIAAGGGGPSTSSRPAIEAALGLADPNKPNVLIIPTAKRTEEAFDAIIPTTEAFFRKLGLKTVLLHGFNEVIDTDKAIDSIHTADLVYTAGGDTLHMMDVLHRHNLTAHLVKRALAGEVVLSGISAGAILPTQWGHSDSLSYRPESADDWEYIRVDGLNLAPFAITPHFNNSTERHGKRSDQFAYTLLGQPNVPAFGIDNLAAIQISDGKITQVQSDPDQFVHVANRDGDSIEFHALARHESLNLTDYL